MNQIFGNQSAHLRVLSILLLGFASMLGATEVLANNPPTTDLNVGFEEACDGVVAFFENFETLLKAASVIIVTIAIVFAGYQIAFAHKRLSDVAPILIGGLLIGGAGLIAGWFTGVWAGENPTC